MFLFEGMSNSSSARLGELLIAAMAQAPAGRRVLHRLVSYDEEDWHVALEAIARGGGALNLITRLERTLVQPPEAALLVFAVCGYARFGWEREQRAGLAAFWPLVARALSLHEGRREALAAAFRLAAERLSLALASEGHHRINTVLRQTGWARGLLRSWFAGLRDVSERERSAHGVRVAEMLKAMEAGELREAEDHGRALLSALCRGEEDQALVAAASLAGLGLGFEVQEIIETGRRCLIAPQMERTGFRIGLQQVGPLGRYRLVLWRLYDAEARSLGAAALVGSGGGRCRLPPSRGRSYLAVPQCWGRTCSVSTAAGEEHPDAELWREEWPGDLLLFKPSSDPGVASEILEPCTSLPQRGPCWLVVPRDTTIHDARGDGLDAARRYPLEQLDGEPPAVLWLLSAELPAPLTVRAADGEVLGVIDRSRAVAIHLRLPAAASTARDADGRIVCAELPELSLPDDAEVEIALAPDGPASLDRTLSCRGRFPGNRHALVDLLPQAKGLLGALRLELRWAECRVSRRFCRVPHVIAYGPQHGRPQPEALLRPHPRMRLAADSQAGSATYRWVRLEHESDSARATLQLELDPAGSGLTLPLFLSWPYRPLGVRLVLDEPVDRRDPSVARTTLSRLRAAARSGTLHEGLFICAPPGTLIRLAFLGSEATIARMGSLGKTRVSLSQVLECMTNANPGASDLEGRLAGRRSAQPLGVILVPPVELTAGFGTARRFTPIALWGNEAPSEAIVSLAEGQPRIQLENLPESWTPPDGARAWLLCAAHDRPWDDAIEIPSRLQCEGGRAVLTATAALPFPGAVSLRARTDRWPRRFAVHLAVNRERMDPLEAYRGQLECILQHADARFSAGALDRLLGRAESHAEILPRTLAWAADKLRARPHWPPEHWRSWLTREVGEEPYLASPLPALLARVHPLGVLEVAAESLQRGQVSLQQAQDWLIDLRLDPWLVTRGMLCSWPAHLDNTLNALARDIQCSARTDPSTSGWFRLPILRDLARRGEVDLGPYLLGLHAAGLPLLHIERLWLEGRGLPEPWPDISAARRLKQGPCLTADAFAGLWVALQRAEREGIQDAGSELLASCRQLAGYEVAGALPPEHLRRDPVLAKAATVAAHVAGLARMWTRLGSGAASRAVPYSAAHHGALDLALRVAPGFFVATALGCELLERRPSAL